MRDDIDTAEALVEYERRSIVVVGEATDDGIGDGGVRRSVAVAGLGIERGEVLRARYGHRTAGDHSAGRGAGSEARGRQSENGGGADCPGTC